MTKERLTEAERILAAYAQKYGLSDEAKDYFSKWEHVEDQRTGNSATNSERKDM